MSAHQHRRPIWIGLAAAAFSPALGLFLLTGSVPASSMDFKVLFLVCLLSFPGIVLLGLPLVLLLKWAEWLTWFNVLVVSVVAGTLYYQILGIFLGEGFQIQYLVEGVVFGLLAGIGFCLGVWPNKSFKADAVNGAA